VGALTLTELSRHLADNSLPNTVRGDAGRLIHGCNTIDAAGEGEITFLANPKYRCRVAETHASAIIMRDDATLSPRIPQIICDDPYRALTLAVVKIHGYRKHPQWGVAVGAFVAETARIGANPSIAPGVVVSDRAVIGANVTLYPGVFVGPECILGDDVVLYANVVVYDGCRLGSRVTIHSGTVIGEDGLGYAPVGESWLKIPQAGRVIIEDEVEIGANCTIDRATLGVTRIGKGTKFSNLIAVGHGCDIGADCMFVAQVGLAGSVTVGRHVTIAGQAGIVGHIDIGDNAQIYAQAGVNADVKPGEKMLGAPAVTASEAKRQFIAIQRLPEMRTKIRSMERELSDLKAILRRLAPSEFLADDREHAAKGMGE
jgi:UDP-3-O-[3-hydroxymyristoyl] glucosamine N-acyltransferase